MRDNALYFPYISVPNDRWTIKTLLYWDRLSSIVPMDHIDSPEQFSPFMHSLVQENLVEQVFPAHHLFEIPDFERCFIKLITGRFKILRRPSSFRSSIYSEKLAPRSQIYAEINKVRLFDLTSSREPSVPDSLITLCFQD